jgi:hypothetical protein
MGMRSRSWRVVPQKPGNLTDGTRGREGASGVNELLEGKMSGTLSLRNNISTRQEKIAQRSRQSPSMVWTTLAHHIDVEWLAEAYRRTRKDGAVGVDGVTAKEYEANLLGNLESLLDRFKSGAYQAPAPMTNGTGDEGTSGHEGPLSLVCFASHGIPTEPDSTSMGV